MGGICEVWVVKSVGWVVRGGTCKVWGGWKEGTLSTSGVNRMLIHTIMYMYPITTYIVHVHM